MLSAWGKPMLCPNPHRVALPITFRPLSRSPSTGFVASVRAASTVTGSRRIVRTGIMTLTLMAIITSRIISLSGTDTGLTAAVATLTGSADLGVSPLFHTSQTFRGIVPSESSGIRLSGKFF